MALDQLMKSIWNEYSTLNPQVGVVHKLLKGKSESIENDHIAYRTVRHDGLGINSLANHFEKYGYKLSGEYFFKEKKLYAQHFKGPETNSPKVFISEIILDDFSDKLKTLIKDAVKKIPSGYFKEEKSLYSGAPWGKVKYKDYISIVDESEYAAWLLVFGFRVNHFTVNVNLLKNFKDLVELNTFLKSNGIALNSAGGEIKGNPKEYLEQSSTLANKIKVQFLEGEYEIPSCYYEFAKRYPMPNGELFQGFVATSADKIFESTNLKSSK